MAEVCLCAACGAEMTGRRRRFCDKQCEKLMQRQLRRVHGKFSTCSRCDSEMYVTTRAPSEMVCRPCRKESSQSFSTGSRDCDFCGDTYERYLLALGRFCSITCSNRGTVNKNTLPNIPCRNCDGVVTRQSKSRNWFCSVACAGRWKSAHTVVANTIKGQLADIDCAAAGHPPVPDPPVAVTHRPCDECGGPLWSNAIGRFHEWCADKRRRQYNTNYNATRRRSRLVKPQRCITCDECGTNYWTRQSNTKYCSRPCSRRAQKARRRAVKAGVERVAYSRVAIFERDRWKCQLCGDPVKRNAKVPHDMAPTIDHIVPLFEGGADTPSNVQLAHFICNSVKGTGSAGSQLRLVG